MEQPDFDSFTKTWHNKPYPYISPSRPELSVSGKNVVITGGGTGIGKATAIAFAQAGARSVSIVGRRIDRLQGAAAEVSKINAAVDVIIETGDVTSPSSINETMQSIARQVGKIDILICNAGVLTEAGPVIGYKESEIRKAFDINVLGAFNTLQAFLPVAASGAKILNTGSGIGHWAPNPIAPGVFSYAATKLATLKMFEYFASENPDIHVASIQPGIIATEINPKITEGFDTVELPAHFFVWLASKEAEFLRGKFVWANWDAEELLARKEEIQSSKLLQVTLNAVNI